MLSLLEIKQKILLRLKPMFEIGCKVIDFPDPPQYSGRALGRAQITVAYLRSTFSEPISYNAYVQSRLIEFGIYLLAQDVRNESLMLPLVEKIQALLTDFEIDANSSMYPVSDEFVEAANGSFARELRFEVSVYHYKKKV